MKLERLREILARASGKRIAVAGDLMLDEFVWGKVGRISPEAPVPVVEVTGESFYPGGAANVARNLREFIDGVSVIGTVGTDDSGGRLLDLLRAQKIQTDLVLEDPDFRTIVKTRIVARHQQVVRVDREEIRGPTEKQVAHVTAGAMRHDERGRCSGGARVESRANRLARDIDRKARRRHRPELLLAQLAVSTEMADRLLFEAGSLA